MYVLYVFLFELNEQCYVLFRFIGPIPIPIITDQVDR